VKYNKYNTTDSEFQPWLKELLHDINVKNLCITFTKSDGTDREMRCTLSPVLIPAEKHPKQSDRSYPETTCRVFDLDKGEWRSFKWESVKEISFE